MMMMMMTPSRNQVSKEDGLLGSAQCHRAEHLRRRIGDGRHVRWNTDPAPNHLHTDVARPTVERRHSSSCKRTPDHFFGLPAKAVPPVAGVSAAAVRGRRNQSRTPQIKIKSRLHQQQTNLELLNMQ